MLFRISISFSIVNGKLVKTRWRPSFYHQIILSLSSCWLLTSEKILYFDDTIYGSTGKLLAYFRPGFKSWITLHPTPPPPTTREFCDVVCHKNKFRAIDFFRIMVWDFSADMYANPTVLQPVARMPRGGLIGVKNLEKLYLVESEDEETHRR